MAANPLDVNEKPSAIPGTTTVYDEVVEVELDANEKASAIPGTTTVYDEVVEVELDASEKASAIPGTTTVYDEVVEVELDANEKSSAIPGTTTVNDEIVEVELDANDKAVAIPGTTSVHNSVVEVDSLDANEKAVAIPGTTTVFNHVVETKLREDSSSGKMGQLRLQAGNPFGLTEEQIHSFEESGFAIIPDALLDTEIENIVNETHELMKRIKTGGHGTKRHTISDANTKRPSPVGRVIATFETEDTAKDPFQRRVARLGSGVHKVPSFGGVTFSNLNRSIVKSFGIKDPRITQSQLITKFAGVGGEVSPHQDGSVSFTTPPSCLTFWYALEDATLENGCLCVAPGSHVTNPLVQRLIKLENGLPKFINLETPVWAQGAKVPTDGKFPVEFDWKPLEVRKGSLLVFHGNLMHKSAPNKSDKDRLAYTFNIIEGGLGYGENNYLKPEDGDFERFL